MNRIVNVREDGLVYEFCYCKEGIFYYYILYFVLYEFCEFFFLKLVILFKKKLYFIELGDDVFMVECIGVNCLGNNWFYIDCVIGGDGDFE